MIIRIVVAALISFLTEYKQLSLVAVAVLPLPGSGPNSGVGQVTSQHATAAQSPRLAEPPAGSLDPDPEPRTRLQGSREISVRTQQHSRTQTGRHNTTEIKQQRRRVMVATYCDVSSLSREVRSGLQRVLEAGHRPLTVSGASCRGLV